MNIRTKTLALVLITTWALVANRSISAADTLTIGFYGMIGFVPAMKKNGSPDGVVAALVNTSNRRLYTGMTHFPAIELNCVHLADDIMKAICGLLPKSPFSDGLHMMNLDQGFDITIEGTNGDVDLKDEKFTKYVVNLAAIGFLGDSARTIHHSLKRLQASAELKDHAIVRVMLRGGKLFGTDNLTDPRGEYVFFNDDHSASKTFSRVATGILYRVPAGRPIVVRLVSYDGKSDFDLEFTGSTTINIVNEPTLADFCQHEPTPGKPTVEHFYGIYALSEADSPAHEPVPVALTPTKQCGEGGQGGREPIICMSALFPGFTYDQ